MSWRSSCWWAQAMSRARRWPCGCSRIDAVSMLASDAQSPASHCAFALDKMAQSPGVASVLVAGTSAAPGERAESPVAAEAGTARLSRPSEVFLTEQHVLDQFELGFDLED